MAKAARKPAPAKHESSHDACRNAGGSVWCDEHPLPMDSATFGPIDGARVEMTMVDLPAMSWADLGFIYVPPANDDAAASGGSIHYDRWYVHGTVDVPVTTTFDHLYLQVGYVDDVTVHAELGQTTPVSIQDLGAISSAIHLIEGHNDLTLTAIDDVYASGTGSEFLHVLNAQGASAVTFHMSGITGTGRLYLADGGNSNITVDHVSMVYGGSGADSVTVTAGVTTFQGGLGADVFGWRGGTMCASDFTAAQGDKFGLHDGTGAISYSSSVWDGSSNVAVAGGVNMENLFGHSATSNTVASAISGGGSMGEIFVGYLDSISASYQILHSMTSQNAGSYSVVATATNLTTQAAVDALNAACYQHI
jgi:hypothetical protein